MNLLDLMIKVGVDDQASEGIGKLADTAKTVAVKVGDGLAGAAKIGLAAVGATTAGVAALTGAALDAAGELEQNIGGSEAVFKEYAQSMQDTATTAYQNMGLSASDFLATANKMGALFQGAGFEIGESASLAADTMQRAADVASIMGIEVSAAMESVAGAAKGNFTMMDNLGVAINDTALNAYALEKGLVAAGDASVDLEKVAKAQDNVTQASLNVQMAVEKQNAAVAKYGEDSTQARQAVIKLEQAQAKLEAANRKLAVAMEPVAEESKNWTAQASTQEKVALAMELFLERSAYAAGNYAKENETLAGSLGTAKAAMADFLSGAGSVDALVSSFENAAEVIQEKVLEILPRLTETGAAAVEALAPQIPAFFDSILPIAVDSVSSVMGTLGGLVVDNIDTTLDSVFSAGELIVNELIDGISGFADGLDTVLESIVAHVENNKDKISSQAAGLATAFITSFTDGVVGIAEAAVSIIKSLTEGLTINRPTLAETAVELMVYLITELMGLLPQIVEVGLQLIVSLASGVADALPELVPTVVSVILQIVETLTDPVNLKNLLKASLEIIVALAEGIANSIPELTDTIVQVIVSICTFLLSPENNIRLIAAAYEIIIALAGGLISALPELSLRTVELIDSLISEFANTDWLQVGADVVDGLLSGIKSAWDSIVNWVTRAWDNVTGIFDGWFGDDDDARTPRYASGTPYHPGGLAWVGEEGPELVELPRGTRVYSAGESADMIAGGGDVVNNYYTFNVDAEDIRELNDLVRIAESSRVDLRISGRTK